MILGPSLRLSKMLEAPLLPSSFCPLLLQSLPSAQPQPQLRKRRTNRVSPRSPRARKKFPPAPHLLLTSRHWCGIPNQFISFPRWSVRELTQGNRSPWLCLQPNRLELLPPPNPAPEKLHHQIIQPSASSSRGSQSLPICPFFRSRTRRGQCRRGDGARAGPPSSLHQTCQPGGSHQKSLTCHNYHP